MVSGLNFNTVTLVKEEALVELLQSYDVAPVIALCSLCKNILLFFLESTNAETLFTHHSIGSSTQCDKFR